MKKEQLGTKVPSLVGQRLRVYAAVNRRTVEDVVSAALDGYLPPLADMISAAADSGAIDKSPALVSAGGRSGDR